MADLDLSRLSVDVLSRAEVEDAFADMGLTASNVHVREEPGGAAALAAFHERLWRRHQTAVAVTCLESVAQRLSALEIPVLVVRPTRSAIASALRTATLLGAQRRLEDAQLAVAVVEVPTLRETSRRSSPRQSREELRLIVHRLLLQEAQRIKATLSPAGEDSFLVTATRGSLSGATDGFRVPPFAERARAELGIALEVGVGLGLTAQDAEAHARAALARAHADPGARGFALDREGHALVPGPGEPVVVRAGNPQGHGDAVAAHRPAPGERRTARGRCRDRGPPARRDLAHGPQAAAHARGGGPGLAAAAEPDSAAGPAAPALPAGDREAGHRHRLSARDRGPAAGRGDRGQCRRG